MISTFKVVLNILVAFVQEINFIDSIKNNILKISIDELKKIQHYWKIKNEAID